MRAENEEQMRDFRGTSFKAAAIAALAVAFSACGGGGGGGGGPPNPQPQPPQQVAPQRPPEPTIAYSGSSAPATIDAANAKTLAAYPHRLVARADALVKFFSLRILDRNFEGTIDATRPGASGGQVRLRGVLVHSAGSEYPTGWLWMEFEDFVEEGLLIDGRVVQDVRTPIEPYSYSIKLTFTALTVTDQGAATILNGTVDDTLVNDVSGNRRTLAVDLLFGDAPGGAHWAEHLVAHGERTSNFTFDFTYSGRIHHSAFGRIDVSSDAPHTVISSDAWPARGGALRVTGANASAGIVPLNEQYAALVLDETGDRIDERFARVKWTSLFEAAPPDTRSPGVANAGAHRLVTVGETIELDGLLSHDADESFLTADWTLAVKPIGSSAVFDKTEPLTPSFTADLPGSYLFVVRANDRDGTAYDAVELQAFESPQTWNWGVQMRFDRPPPTALGTSVVLDGGSSRRESLVTSFPPLDVLYDWRLDAPPGSNAAQTAPTFETSTFIPDVAGFYRVRLQNAVPSTNHASSATKLVGFGTGFQFFESVPLALPVSVYDVSAADFNGDGLGDLAAIGSVQTLGHRPAAWHRRGRPRPGRAIPDRQRRGSLAARRSRWRRPR